jgi:hypothetical protein
MRDQSSTGEFLTATTPDGMLIIHNLPITLSWVPRDVINNVYNFGGIVTVGTFDSTDDAKRVAKEQHSVPLKNGRSAIVLSLREISAALKSIRQRSMAINSYVTISAGNRAGSAPALNR